MMYCTGLSLTGLAVCRPSQTGTITQLVLSSSSIAENGTGGELVGTLSMVGTDFVAPVTYAIASDPSLKFEIAGVGLDELRVKALTTVNFETNPSFSLGLRATDSTLVTPKTFDLAAMVFVTNVNEAPTNIDLLGTTVVDTAAAGTVIGVVSNPLDPDALDTFTWSIAPGGDPSANFEVVGTDFRVAVGNTLGNAVNASHAVTLRVTDAGGLFFDKAFTISVTAGAAAAFLPTDLTIMPEWYRGKFGVTVGTGVQNWADQGTNASDLTQAVGAQQPAYDAVNGILNFDGIDDFLDTRIPAMSGTDVHIFAVGAFDAGQIWGRYLSHTSAVDYNNLSKPVLLLRDAGTLNLATYASSVRARTDASEIGAIPKLVHSQVVAGVSKLFINSLEQVQNNTVTTPLTAIGLTVGEGNNANGKMALREVVYVRGPMTAQEVINTETYLKAEWGI